MVCINHMRTDEKKYMAFLLHGPEHGSPEAGQKT